MDPANELPPRDDEVPQVLICFHHAWYWPRCINIGQSLLDAIKKDEEKEQRKREEVHVLSLTLLFLILCLKSVFLFC